MKNIQKKIREILKTKQDIIFINEKDISDNLHNIINQVVNQIINQVVNQATTQDITDYNDHIQYIAPYTHYYNKTNTYKYNLKKKRTSNIGFEIILIKKNEIKQSSQETTKETENNTLNMKNEDSQENINDVNNIINEYKKMIEINNANTDDDVSSKDMLKKFEKFKELRQIESPKQRSEEWFKLRESAITASDGASAIGQNKYEAKINFIFKKCGLLDFVVNANCYNGTKYEQIATMIYEKRHDVRIDEFGLMKHPKLDFLAASPDGICNGYKYDGVHKSNKIGRMLEIKCPTTRTIQKKGNIIGDICPLYYWIQIQQQLECCDLDECDFWQCKILEYSTRDEFIEDTNKEIPYLSNEFGMEKGCIIQLLPKNEFKKINTDYQYNNTVYQYAKFLYPPKIEMSPTDIDLWIAETISKTIVLEHNDYILDRVIFWKLQNYNNTTIQRDNQWFKNNLPLYKDIWDKVLFFRENKDKVELLYKYIKIKNEEKKFLNDTKKNDLINKLCDTSDENYDEFISNLLNIVEKYENENGDIDIESNKARKPERAQSYKKKYDIYSEVNMFS